MALFFCLIKHNVSDNTVINNYVFKGGFPYQTSYTILLSTRFLVLFYWELLY